MDTFVIAGRLFTFSSQVSTFFCYVQSNVVFGMLWSNIASLYRMSIVSVPAVNLPCHSVHIFGTF